MMRRFLGILLINLFLLPGALGAQSPAETRDWCVSVWYPSSDTPGGLDSIRDNLDVINIVNPFWYSPAPNGTLIVHPGAENADQLQEWREAGLTILPTIFSSVAEVLATPETRAFHISQIVELVERLDYDGIDIDYEGFPASTRDNFSTFIEALAAELHPHGRQLSIAVHAKTDAAGTWEGAAAQDWTRLAPAVDIFNIMTYDYTSRNDPPGPIGPVNWVLDVLEYAATITDLAKVRMGLHFYGYSWLRDQPPATATTWAAAQQIITSFKLEVIRNAEDMEAHIDFKARGLPKQTLYFADAEGLAFKLDQVLATYPDLGGVAIWGLGGEDPDNWKILRARRSSNCH